MELVRALFVDPVAQMIAAPDLLAQTIWEGFVAGVLYSLIALGFVLIYKASGVFNFAQGIMMAGTPDQVESQIRKVYDHVGGFGHLLIMGQAGFLEHDETVAGIRMFAREVYPRVKQWA